MRILIGLKEATLDYFFVLGEVFKGMPMPWEPPVL